MSHLSRTWKHAFKLDPDREIGEEALERLCLSGSDAIIVGGSTGITYEKTLDLLYRIRRYEMMCALEVSVIDAVVPGFDVYLIPMVLNTNNSDWIIGHHLEAIRRFGAIMPWNKLIVEGYIILNPDSAAAKVAQTYQPSCADEICALAELADRLLQLPLIYIEYSGMYGDMELVRRIRSQLVNARLIYGGGIDGLARAEEARKAADTIVVGNLIYDDFEAALATIGDQS